MKSSLYQLGVIFILIPIFWGTNSANASNRDRLKQIVTECLDVSSVDYCTACPLPRVDAPCGARDCQDSLEVWKESGNYVAIRDKKMCRCTSKGFVHGLAIPRALVTGVEAINRPNGIWEFAWKISEERNIANDEAALVVNPKGDRSQDQLHVHILRLLDNAREKFKKDMIISVNTLDKVWSAAAKRAGEKGLTDYGVLVARDKMSGFIVLIDAQSPEEQFTRAKCQP